MDIAKFAEQHIPGAVAAENVWNANTGLTITAVMDYAKIVTTYTRRTRTKRPERNIIARKTR